MKESAQIFQFDRAEDSSGFLLWQVTNIWQRKIRAGLSPLGLTHVQFVLLANIAWLGRDSDEITQIQLANQAKTDIMMTSQVLRTLEKKKLILRTPHTTDSRAKSITLTEEGLVLVTKAAKIVEQADMTFFGTLETQLAEFNKSMRKILEEAQ